MVLWFLPRGRAGQGRAGQGRQSMVNTGSRHNCRNRENIYMRIVESFLDTERSSISFSPDWLSSELWDMCRCRYITSFYGISFCKPPPPPPGERRLFFLNCLHALLNAEIVSTGTGIFADSIDPAWYEA